MDIRSPLAGSVVAITVEPGRSVRAGAVLAIVESMKMEHEVRAEGDGEVAARAGSRRRRGGRGRSAAQPAPAGDKPSAGGTAACRPVRRRSPAEPGRAIRDDLLELRRRDAFTLDSSRPEAVAKRHALGLRTARENIADLCDAGSFVEYGALAFAAQQTRRPLDDLIRNTPADGMVTGIGSVNAAQFGAERSRAVVMAYDATVLAGTQGMRNHQKTDRMLGIALAQKLPVVLFAEGGGGRPGDVDMPIVAGLHVATFASFARLSGQVPVLGIAAGRCFAGNAALLGCCDTIVATRASSIGMGGPAMVEGGGLGRFRPEEIGPGEVQSRSGVIDVLVEDEAEAVAVARALPVDLPGPASAHGRSPTPRPCASCCRRTACASTRSARSSRRSSTSARRSSCAPASAPASSPRSPGSKVARSASSPATRRTSAARSTPTRPTRPPASCSCATRTACRSSR